MKVLLAVAALLFSVQSFAQNQASEQLSQEVMELLVRVSNTVQLRELGEDSDMKLSEALAQHMLSGSYVKQGHRTTLTSTIVMCKDTTNGRIGAVSYECSVSLLNGDFKKSGTKFQGPELESSLILSKIKIRKIVNPHAEMQLSDLNIEVTVAG